MISQQRYCGLIAIVGRPNVGKSTLLNGLLGQKISITSRKPQTTRHRILGILTEQHQQAVLVDTPGLHQDEKRAITRLMNRAASSSIAEVETILFLVEGTHWTNDDELVLSKIKKSTAPCILVVNKVDNVQDKESLLPHLKQLGSKHLKQCMNRHHLPDQRQMLVHLQSSHRHHLCPNRWENLIQLHHRQNHLVVLP